MKFYYLFMLIIISGCKNVDKLACYKEQLNDLKTGNVYNHVIRIGRTELPLLKGERGRSFFRDSTYVDSVVIDDAVFFNKEKDKCLLLILQQTSKDLYVDEVRIVQGTKISGEWKFQHNRMPDVPETIFTVRKTGPRNRPQNSSFKHLSEEGRRFVLEAGSVKNSDCNIDEKYWFGTN